MEKRKINNKIILALSALLIICLLLASVLSLVAPNNTAQALKTTNIASATKVGGGADMWNLSTSSINRTVVDDLISKLFAGESNYREYIKNSTNLDTQTESYIVPATKINAKVNNADYGLVLTLGGLEWLVASLTVTNDTKEDIVMTLYLAESLGSATFFKNSGKARMVYSSSGLRNHLLTNSNFKLFSDDTEDGFAKTYLVQPKNIKYQHTESMVDRNGPANYNYPNDALDSLSSGWHNGADYQPDYTVDGFRYDAWGDDYIWEPSGVETGYGDYPSMNSLWKLSVAQIQHSNSTNYAWVRSANYSSSYDAVRLIKHDGKYDWSTTNDSNPYGVRPAIHVNLSALGIDFPQDINDLEYTGKKLSIEDAYNAGLADWYDASYASMVDVEYYNSTMVKIDPVEPGAYKARFSLKDTSKNCWADGSIDPKDITITIIPKYIDFPDWIDSHEEVYNGGEPILFTLKYYADLNNQLKAMGMNYYQVVNFTHAGTLLNNGDTSSGGVSLDISTGDITASDVGKYTLDISLADTKHFQWKIDPDLPSDKQRTFEIKKKTIYLELTGTGEDNLTQLKGMEKSKLPVKIEVDSDTNKQPNEGKDLFLTIMAVVDQGMPIPIATDIKLTAGMINESREIIVELDLSKLKAGRTYTLVVDTESDVYEIAEIPKVTLEVEAKVSNVLTWNLYADNKKQISFYYDAQLTETDATFGKELTYNGKAYRFEAKLPTGYSLKTSEFLNGYEVVPGKGAANTKAGTNADTYITKVAIYKDSDPNKATLVYTISWEIKQVIFDLSEVKWLYDDGSSLQLPYDKINGSKAQLDPKTLPAGLEPIYPDTNEGSGVGRSGVASVTFKLASGYDDVNYILPYEENTDSYVGDDFAWSRPWNIVKATIQSTSWKNVTATDDNNHAFTVPKLRDPNADDGIVEYDYYETDSMGNIINNTALKESDIVWSESEAKFYIVKPILKDTDNYELDNPESQSKVFRVGKDLTKVTVSLEKYEMEYNTNQRHAKVVVANGALPTTAFDLTYYDGYTKLSTAPTEVGKYRVEVNLKNTYIDRYQIDGDYEFDYEIVKAQIPVEWNDNAKPSVLKLSYGQINGVEYEIVDADDNIVAYHALQAGVTYRIKAKIKDNQLKNFIFADGTVETDWHEFSVSSSDRLDDPNSKNNPAYPQTDPDLPKQDPTDPDDTTPSGNLPNSGNNGGIGGGSVDFGKISEALKEWWQVIASVISIILIIIFVSKGIGYANRKKENDRQIKKYSNYYAGATGLFDLAMSAWTAIACVLMGLAVAAFVFMMIEKSSFNKSQRKLEDAKDDYDRAKKDEEKENMRMMFMGMMGGNNGGMGQGMPQGGYAFVQQGLGADEIRGIVSETMTAMLPGMQQLLPQQASTNDEVIKQMMKTQEELAHNQELLMKKMSEQPAERVVVEKEVAATTANDERFEQMMKTQESLMRNQETLMQKILDLSATQPSQPQVQIIEKEVPVEVEKIVEKEVVKEVPVEKIVEKVVHVKAEPKSKKESQPRLTLDEAYALLSKQQQKYFDGLREYALSKPNTKEKKSTYSITIGQSTVNPLLKLTIKKDTTVALFKMEDEYLKDIKRDATSDGTKIKVKETEVIIGDAQACKAAKNMIDLREDQIERYQDLLKEQRAMRK